MTPGKDKFSALDIEKKLMEIVKLEYALKKHFIYIDHIDDLKHKELVVREFDKAIRIVNELIAKVGTYKRKL